MNETHLALVNSLEILFRNKEDLGFWDEQSRRIISRIEFNKNFEWQISSAPDSDRYGTFTLTCILLSKKLFNLDTSKYDHKIKAYLNYIFNNIDNYNISTITYGAFNALLIGNEIYDLKIPTFTEKIKTTYNLLTKKIPKIQNNEFSLVLIGLSIYLKEIDNNQQVQNYINHLVKNLLNSQNNEGFFITGDLRGNYHQRTMYTLWGLAFASEVCESDPIKIAIKKTLSSIWENRRDREKDNGFIWHPALYLIKNKYGLLVPIISFKSSKYLFECHQTFFSNSVYLYQHFFEKDFYQIEGEKSLQWIFGENRIKKSLITLTKIGIPSRVLDFEGNLYIEGQNFKGSYEIGSFILALSRKNQITQ